MSENNDQDLSEREKELLKVVAEMTNGICRALKKLKSLDIGDNTKEVELGIKHLESVLGILKREGFEIRDHSGDLYDIGMALNVLTFQPTSNIKEERIIETIKPTIYYKDKILQRGHVIVAKPE